MAAEDEATERKGEPCVRPATEPGRTERLSGRPSVAAYGGRDDGNAGRDGNVWTMMVAMIMLVAMATW